MTSPSNLSSTPPASGVAEAIASFDRGRDPVLLARKYAAMRASAFAFMRGACHVFYRSLPAAPTLYAAPLAWLSGDLHVENFGAYKGDNRLTYFDVTDFDECVLAPFTLDVVRLVTSIRVGAAEWGIAADDADGLASRALVAYATEVALGKPAWLEREQARGLVKRVFAQVAGRARTEMLDRISTRKGKRRRLTIDGRSLLAPSDAERNGVIEMLAGVAEAARDAEYFKVVDVARRIAGVGSVGMPRFVALVEGRGSPDRNALLDLKCARPSALSAHDRFDRAAWRDDAERVVTVQRHSVVVAPAFLQSAAWDGASFSVRELQPSVDRVRMKDWERQPKKVGEAVATIAGVAAWMHLRGGAWRGSAAVEELAAFAVDTAWRNELLSVSRDAASRLMLQFTEFGVAYDAGFFAPLP